MCTAKYIFDKHVESSSGNLKLYKHHECYRQYTNRCKKSVGEIFSGIIYCIILMCVKFIFFTFFVSSVFRNLSNVLISEIIPRVFFPFFFNAGFGCQRPSIMPDIPPDIIPVILINSPLYGNL